MRANVYITFFLDFGCKTMSIGNIHDCSSMGCSHRIEFDLPAVFHRSEHKSALAASPVVDW